MNIAAIVFGMIALIILAVGWNAWPKSNELDLAPASRWTFGRILLVLVCVATLGSGAYFGNHVMTCQNLEDDYLNSVSAMKSATASASILRESDITKTLDTIRDQQVKKAEATMRGLYEQCGTRSAETAARKGAEMLLP